MQHDQDATITPTPRQLRALTHPARLRMLGLLRAEGPATATALAERLGLNTGATSYHLRQLAEHGFIEDDHARGSGRERWWRAVFTSTRTDTPEPTEPEANDDFDAYLQTVATVHTEQLQRALEERPLLPHAWRVASTLSDWHHHLTPTQARVLIERIDELLSEVVDDDSDEAATVVFQVNAFPRPGILGRDPA